MQGLLRHWTKSSIIPSSKGESVWRNKRPKKRTVSFVEDRLLTWSTSTSGSLEPTNSVENYADLFTIVLRNDNVQEFDSKWDEILLSMTKIPSDNILEVLYKFWIRGSEKLKTVLDLYKMEIHQKKAGPDYHRLKTMVKRNIEQELRNKNFGARNGNFEKKRRGQESGNKTAWTKNSGRLLAVESLRAVCERRQLQFPSRYQYACKIDTAESVSKFFHAAEWGKCVENPKSQRQKSQWWNVECLDGLAIITSEELAITHSVKSGILLNACSTRPRVVVGLGRSAHSHIVRLMNSRRKGLKRIMTNVLWLCWKREIGKKENLSPMDVTINRGNLIRGDEKLGQKSSKRQFSDARQLGCVFQDSKPPKSSSILRKSSDIRKPLRCVQFTKAVVRHAYMRNQNPLFGMICPGDPQRNPNAPKFEDRSQEETEWQEQGAREAAKVPVKQRWGWLKSILKSEGKNKAAFFSPSENCCLPASNLKLDEREFVVDSGASMHMISKKDLNSAEMDTSTTSRSPTTVITANGEVQTHEEATVYVLCPFGSRCKLAESVWFALRVCVLLKVASRPSRLIMRGRGLRRTVWVMPGGTVDSSASFEWVR